MTMQEIFDTSVGGLIKQGCQSVDGVCRYRGPNGTKCAAGQLISDEDYERFGEGIEGSSWRSSRFNSETRGVDLYYDLSDEVHNFISQLQNVHDSRANWTASMYVWTDYRNLAVEKGLSTKVLDEAGL